MAATAEDQFETRRDILVRAARKQAAQLLDPEARERRCKAFFEWAKNGKFLWKKENYENAAFQETYIDKHYTDRAIATRSVFMKLIQIVPSFLMRQLHVVDISGGPACATDGLFEAYAAYAKHGGVASKYIKNSVATILDPVKSWKHTLAVLMNETGTTIPNLHFDVDDPHACIDDMLMLKVTS
eukprot:gene18150-21620_t